MLHQELELGKSRCLLVKISSLISCKLLNGISNFYTYKTFQLFVNNNREIKSLRLSCNLIKLNNPSELLNDFEMKTKFIWTLVKPLEQLWIVMPRESEAEVDSLTISFCCCSSGCSTDSFSCCSISFVTRRFRSSKSFSQDSFCSVSSLFLYWQISRSDLNLSWFFSKASSNSWISLLAVGMIELHFLVWCQSLEYKEW